MKTKDELEVLRDVARRLESRNIAYMLTGSMAMNLYAEPRMTRDLDIVVELHDPDAKRLAELFEPDYYVSQEEIELALRSTGMFNLIHQASVTKIDCIIEKPDAMSRAAFARRKKVKVDGCEIYVIGKEDLIVAKLIWLKESDSAQQKRDIRNLLQTECDEALLERLTTELGLTELLESLR
ncbi:MAG: hypothetical protein NZM06_10060 [Chloroherpetonaceae bacterium]|nr:hypothetical protein [Chloroherpetonaceae bacterium]MDW8437419.1 DUF6036 family nucleotidyltransferase [Chloroherpetonaceae bacterium]